VPGGDEQAVDGGLATDGVEAGAVQERGQRRVRTAGGLIEPRQRGGERRGVGGAGGGRRGAEEAVGWADHRVDAARSGTCTGSLRKIGRRVKQAGYPRRVPSPVGSGEAYHPQPASWVADPEAARIRSPATPVAWFAYADDAATGRKGRGNQRRSPPGAPCPLPSPAPGPARGGARRRRRGRPIGRS
jgi:hypothetical protein